MTTLKKLFSTLRVRIFCLFTLCFTVLLSVVFFIVRISSTDAFLNVAVNSSQREMASITDVIETDLQHMSDYCVTAATNETIIAAAKNNPSLPETEIGRYEVRKKLTVALGSIIGMNKNVYMWDVVSLNGDYFNAGGYDLSSFSDFSIEKMISMHEDNYSTEVTGPYYYTKLNTKEPQKLFAMTKPIVDLNTRKIYGYILFLFRDKVIDNAFCDYRPADSRDQYIVFDSADEMLMSSFAEELTKKDVGYYQDKLKTLQNQGSFIGNLPGSGKIKQVFCYTRMEETEWQMIHMIPLQELMREEQVFKKIYILSFVTMLLVFLFLSMLIAHSITKPVLTLSGIMKNVAEESYTTIEIPEASEEIKILYRGYNALVTQTQELLETIYEEQKEKADYQFQLVQAQIKPHFLYNALGMIKSMVDIGIYDQASEAINALSLFYRYSLSKGSDIVSIPVEIDISRQYLYIQKLRHMEYFDYEITGGAGLEEYMIPKLTLQPVLENAIVHGAMGENKKCSISLTVIEQEKTIEFHIKDDGRGMQKAELEKLNAALNSSDRERRSFGLHSINRRIRLLFGAEYGLQIRSEYGKGTEVVLTIPKIKINKSYSDIWRQDENNNYH